MTRKMKYMIAILIIILNLIFGMILLWSATGSFFSKINLGGALTLSFMEILIIYKIVAKSNAESELMANRLNSLVNQGASFHVLLDTDSPNFELSKAINRVESYQKKKMFIIRFKIIIIYD